MKHTPTPHRIAAAIGLVSLLATAWSNAGAAVLIDNLAEPTRDTTIVESELWAAQSFTTAAEAVWLDSVTLLLGVAAGAASTSAELRADGLAGPGALLTSLMLPVLSAGAPQPETLSLALFTQLAPLTTYWIVLGTAGDSFGWSYAEGNASSGPGQLGDYRYSSDNGLSWASFGADNPYQMRIDVTAVPEPAAAWLLAAGLAVVWTRRRLMR